MTVTKATAAELPKIQALYMNSFPKSERKPFELILKKQTEGVMEVLTLNNECCGFTGLAIMILYKDLVLLDYFAILPEYRGTGYGSIALKLLKERYIGKRFLLEIENPNTVCDNKQERFRRKCFYTKNGMTAMPYTVDLFGVEMEIMTSSDFVTFDEYHDIFKNIFGSGAAQKVKKV